MQTRSDTQRHFVHLFLLLGMLCVACIPSLAALPQPTGFTAETLISLVLDHDQVYRADYDYFGHAYTIDGTIRITGGQGTTTSNKVMLYGDRTGELFAGESDWQMTPRPINVFMTSQQTSFEYTFPFGPFYGPTNQSYWSQYYGYTAVCHRVNSTSTSGCDTLEVISAAVTNSTTTIIPEDDTY